jgi:hypothetical protein
MACLSIQIEVLSSRCWEVDLSNSMAAHLAKPWLKARQRRRADISARLLRQCERSTSHKGVVAAENCGRQADNPSTRMPNTQQRQQNCADMRLAAHL